SRAGEYFRRRNEQQRVDVDKKRNAEKKDLRKPKSKIQNSKMDSASSQERKYDLAGRTEKFATDVRKFVSSVKKTFENSEDLKQLIRSAGSVGANYIEAEEYIGEKTLFSE